MIQFGSPIKRAEIRTLEEFRNALLDHGSTRASAVSADTANMIEEPLRALNDVALVPERVQQDILVLQQLGVFEDTENLAEESDGLLVELLGISNIGGDDLGEGQVLVALLNLRPVVLRLDGQLTTHGVFSLDHVRVDVFRVEPAHCFCCVVKLPSRACQVGQIQVLSPEW